MKIKCPACAKVLSIPETAAGKVVKCPCGKQLRAPNAPAQGQSSNPTSAAPSAAAPKQPASTGGIDAGMFDDLTDNDLQPVKTSSNPYQSPVGAASTASAGNQELASIGARIGGALIDGLFVIVVLIPGLFFAGGSLFAAISMSEDPSAGEVAAGIGVAAAVGIIFVSAIIPMIVQVVLISKSGQSLGKRIVGTRMVDQHTGETVGFVQGYLVRTFVFGLITGLPAVGGLIAIADIIFLFIDGQQTLHDRLAKTRVVCA